MPPLSPPLSRLAAIMLLFVVLATVMRVTRNVDWYEVIAQKRAERKAG